jgi:hypothetical protein
MNPWLVTWEVIDGQATSFSRSRLAAILHNQAGERQVKKLMEHSYAEYMASSDQPGSFNLFPMVQLAKRKGLDKARRIGMFPVFRCGLKPYLKARQVFNCRWTSDETGAQTLSWEERFYPALNRRKDLEAVPKLAKVPCFQGFMARKPAFWNSFLEDWEEDQLEGQIDEVFKSKLRRMVYSTLTNRITRRD